MENQDLIRDQIENTRGALAEKLEILEDKVASTVNEASQGVTQVAQTVETVTDAVHETVATVKETVDDTLVAVKESVNAVTSVFDLPGHMQRYPWLFVGGSMACGFFLGETLARRAPATVRTHQPPPVSQNNGAAASLGTGRQVPAPPADGSENGESVLERFEPELSKLKGLALGTLMGTIREIVASAAGHEIGQSLSEIIDDMTKKMGGTPITPEGLAEISAASGTSSDDANKRKSEAGAAPAATGKVSPHLERIGRWTA